MKDKVVTIEHTVRENENTVFSVVEQITHHMVEEQDAFIYEQFSSYLGRVCKMTIPKKLLERALSAFAKEHPEEWEAIMEEANGETL